MNTDKTYDCKALIDTYINTQRQDYPHEDFTDYYVALLAALEDAFGISFTEKEVPNMAFWILFRSTVTSYLQIRHPWSGFLEVGMLPRRLKESGDAGNRVIAFSDELFKRAQETQQIHLNMLYDLFEIIFGKIDMVITSEELRQAGFDDSTEPELKDYDEFI